MTGKNGERTTTEEAEKVASPVNGRYRYSW